MHLGLAKLPLESGDGEHIFRVLLVTNFEVRERLLISLYDFLCCGRSLGGVNLGPKGTLTFETSDEDLRKIC